MKSKGSQTYQVDPTTNRYMGYSYNEAGAVTADGSYTFSYDPVGQPLSKIYGTNNTTQEYYLYTASDERIGVQRAGWWTWSVRDQSGKVLRQYKSSVTNPSGPALWLEDYVWRDGLLLGSQRPVEMGGRRHFHLDHLGTPRLITSDNGQRVSYHDYYPFGDEQTTVAQEVPGGFDREEPLKFTGHERDYAGGMGGEDGHAVDYMHARYYGPGVGRFLSVDPVEGDTSRPQSWNRYTYVSNNPVSRTDPTGKYQCVPNSPKAGGNCTTIDLAVDKIRYAEAHLSKNDPQRAQLHKVVVALGAKGDPTSTISHIYPNAATAQGTRVIATGKTLGAPGKEKGSLYLSLENAASAPRAGGDTDKIITVVAGTIAHEADHRLQPILGDLSRPSLLSHIFYEYEAYSLENAVYRGNGEPSLSQDATKGAWGSASQACEQAGGCRP